MSRSETTQSQFTEMALPRPIRLVSRLLETFRRANEVDEEERHLLNEEHFASPSPDYPLALSHLEGGDLSALDLDSVPAYQRYVLVAQGLRSSLPSTHRWLHQGDLRIIGEHPVAAGGFANIWEGVLNGRKVMVKSYRCYVLFDHVQVISVRCHRCLCEADC